MRHYKYLLVEQKDNYAIVTLNRGRSNPLNLAMMQELHNCFDALNNDPAIHGIILTGKKDFFSVGVDVLEVFEYTSKDVRAFWASLIRIMIKLAKSAKPLIAAITGHAPAGGCVLALPADYRIMAEGKYTIGLNELPLGLAVPDIFFRMYAFWLAEKNAYHYLLEGKLLTVEQALNSGLIDETCSMSDILNRAEIKIQTYLSIIPAVFQRSKLNFRKKLLQDLEIDVDKTIDAFIVQWWSEETQAAIGALVANLKSKKI